MKRSCLYILAFIGLFCSQAQNNPYFGHYMFNPSYLNPAWAGGEQKAFVAFQHRTQWLGYSSSFDGPGGAPSTQMLTGIVPIKGFALSSLGLNLINDNLGPLTNLQLAVPVTYTWDLQNGLMAFGVSPSLYSQSLNTNDYRPNEPNDSAIPSGGSVTQISPNLGAGIFYRGNNGFFLGASAQDILRPGFSFGLDSLDNRQEITYTLHSGYSLKLTEKLVLSPTAILRSNLRGFTFDIGAIVTLADKMWGGISYRKGESAIMFLGYSLLENNILKVGYSFDYVVQDQAAKAATSHEIFMRYDLPDIVFGGRKKVKTPRFSY